jgi:hypothetical protein
MAIDPEVDHLLESLIFAALGHDDDPGGAPLLPHGSHESRAIEARHLHVQQDEVTGGASHQGKRIHSVLGLADQLEILSLPQKLGNSTTKERVIVYDEDFDRCHK